VGRIGSTLRETRLRLGLSLTDAQKATKIRVRYLEALEQEHFDLLPGAPYARGFLRSYAYLLGLDPDPLLDELAPLLAELEPPLPPPAPRRRLPVSALTIVIAGAVVALFAGLAVLGLSSGGGPPLRPPPAARSPKAASAQATRPAPAAASAPRRRAPSLVLTAARGDCWLSVRRGSSLGALVWEGLLRRGSSLRLARLPLWVRMGAPWNLEARLGAKPLAGLPTAPRPANLLVTRAGATPA
jgi:cytoskeleton protein RodZ